MWAFLEISKNMWVCSSESSVGHWCCLILVVFIWYFQWDLAWLKSARIVFTKGMDVTSSINRPHLGARDKAQVLAKKKTRWLETDMAPLKRTHTKLGHFKGQNDGNTLNVLPMCVYIYNYTSILHACMRANYTFVRFVTMYQEWSTTWNKILPKCACLRLLCTSLQWAQHLIVMARSEQQNAVFQCK